VTPSHPPYPPYPVIDVHVHVQPLAEMRPAARALMGRTAEEMAALEALMRRPEEILARMDRAGVERIVMINYVSPDLMGFTAAVNDFAAGIARHAPDRLVPFGGVHPRYTSDPGGDVERLREMGIRGLKIHPPHQEFAANAYLDALPGLAAVYGKAQELGMPVMIHTGTSIFPGARNRFADPMPADDVAVDFPDLVLILAHAGRPLHTETAFFLARRHPNVHLDVSGIPPRRLLHYLPRLPQIADKVLWGTDWPSPGVHDLSQNIDEFLALDLSSDVQRKILHDNAYKIFGWEGAG
jgi:predicted TIM-barrel fold metal-dependent hydrolase